MKHPPSVSSGVLSDETDTSDVWTILAPLASHLRLLLIGPILFGVLALGGTYLIKPTFTARTSFIPPQQQQAAAASALASIGSLAGLAGSAGVIKSPADQYVALMQSTTVQDRVIDKFDLMKIYDADYRFEARKELQDNVRISLGKRDGLITVEVDDNSPERAAEIANSYVDELRRVTATLAVTEAQQRRVFFDHQLKLSKERLTSAQEALQGSGFSQGALNAEPKAAAERYARLKAEVTAAEVRLQTMGSYLSNTASEVLQQRTALSALQGQLLRAEQANDLQPGTSYISKFRDFKYEETLFELFARQYELARADESREGALIQVIDAATAPERKSRPRRAITAVLAVVVSAVALVAFVLLRNAWMIRRRRRDVGPGAV